MKEKTRKVSELSFDELGELILNELNSIESRVDCITRWLDIREDETK